MGGLASDIDAAAAAAKAAAVGALGVRGGVGGWVEGAELGAAPNRAADNIPEGLGCGPGDLESKSFSCLESGKMVRISFKMGATTAEAKETAFGKKLMKMYRPCSVPRTLIFCWRIKKEATS